MFSPPGVGHSLLAAAVVKPFDKSSLAGSGMFTKPQANVNLRERLRRLREWATVKVKQQTVRQKLLNLRPKSVKFQAAYDHPNAYRTSNMLDRLMNYQDRLLYNMQYFHDTKDSARLQLRAMALIWNFHPYGSRTKLNNPARSSPFQELNRFQYHDNWLHNLLIPASMNGQRPGRLVDHRIR